MLYKSHRTNTEVNDVRYMIGVDAGTSNVKAVIFDEAGTQLYTATEENEPLCMGDALLEQDMLLLWEKTATCIRDVSKCADIQEKDDVVIGVTGQGEGIWMMDKAGNPVQNAILWCDGRAVKEVEYVTKEKPEIGRMIHETTGTPPLTGTQLMLLAWMRNHRLEALNRADVIFFCKDWIRYKLTNTIGADFTDSSTSLIHVQTKQVAHNVFKALDLVAYERCIPQPVTSDTIVSTITQENAKSLHLPSTTNVIAGAIDVCASAVGVGAMKENDTCVILGTTCANEMIIEKEHCLFGRENTRYEKYPLHNLYMMLQPTMNGTPNIDWMVENLSLTDDFSTLDALIEKVPVGSGGVIYHPYINKAGERSPFYHRYARASFFGISSLCTRDHLIRSVYEGVAYSIRDCLGTDFKGKQICIAGGGAKSDVWLQIIADVLGLEIVVSSCNELGAKGVALMGGVARGFYASYEEAKEKACHFKKTFTFDEKRHKQYDALFNLYKELRLQYSSLWTLRHEVTTQIKQV